MKKLAFAIASLAWVGFASAGDYHVNDVLKCSQCHTMHASRTHSLSNGSADANFPVADQTGVGNDKLLTYSTVNLTCLACHDGSHFPDVLGADANVVWDRSAGALNAVSTGLGKSGSVGTHSAGNAKDGTAYADWMGHTMGALASVVPPGMPSADATAWTADGSEFNCSDCHAVHGSVSYRNLGNSHGRAAKAALAPVTYTEGASLDATFDVNILDSTAPMSTKSVVFGKGAAGTFKGVASSPAGMNQFCAGCHGNFHGDTNIKDGAGAFIKHPTTGVNYAATNLIGGAQTALTRPLWADAAQTSFDVGCLTCHKGHGNARGYGLLYPGPMTEGTTYTGSTNKATLAGNAAIVDYENGDGAKDSRGSYPIRNLCATCHSQSRTLRK